MTKAGYDLGFVGLGRHGRPDGRAPARRRARGHRLRHQRARGPVHGRSEGQRRRGSAAEVAAAAEIVMTSLPTPDTVHGVALGEAGIAARRRGSGP